MSYRSVKSVPAFVAGIVAATNLATMTDLRAQSAEQAAEASTQVAQAATDSCLSSPKGATPAGSHWYYRIDRTTKRQCWYLREESDKADDKFARAAPPASAPAPSSAAAEGPQPAARKSISDARAEWVSQPPRAEPVKADPRTTGTVLAENSQRGSMPNVLAPSPLSSMRWNDAPTAATVSTTPASLQVAAAATPATTQPPPAPAAEVQQPVVDQVTPAPAEPMTAAKPTASLQMLFLVIAAALALAGLIVSAMVRIGRMRARRAMRKKRRKMWDSARTRRAPQPSPQPMFQDEDARPRRPAVAVHNTHVPQERAARVPQERAARVSQERAARVPRERPRAPQSYAPQERVRAPQERRPAPQDRDREQQMTEMLARLARSAQT
ncbi:hypothetical protein CQ12_03970 [Bradyrhizobium jicamae]|uniref:Uncharacterized protein n=1 Tax=Bradyrhizobium jicamae TaxID=280332 RepID=A0A0R3KLE1_9BRAD|nr:hypothetical protein [Bradyrhizobium jicamae]KRQ95741.1 hypothetical protein CQ12_03970 [Bradyrhizobium jicamae]